MLYTVILHIVLNKIRPEIELPCEYSYRKSCPIPYVLNGFSLPHTSKLLNSTKISLLMEYAWDYKSVSTVDFDFGVIENKQLRIRINIHFSEKADKQIIFSKTHAE